MRFGGFGYEQQFGFGLSPTPAASAAPAYAAWPALVGAEMMEDTGCADPTKWDEGAGVTINVVPGKMVATTATSSTTNAGTSAIPSIPGATYRCSETVETASLGNFLIVIGGADGASHTTTGAKSEDLVAVDDGPWTIQFTSATMQLDNFSVKSIGLMGVSGDWSCTGDASFDTDYIVFEGGGTAALTGSAQAAFDAAVSDSTLCSVTLTPNAGIPADGPIEVSPKEGTPVTFTFDGSGAPVTHNVTSGTGSGFLMDGSGGAIGQIARVQIALA